MQVVLPSTSAGGYDMETTTGRVKHGSSEKVSNNRWNVDRNEQTSR